MRFNRLLAKQWQETLRNRRDRVAVTELTSDKSYTFSQLEHAASAWADRIGVEKLDEGDRVLVKLPNSDDFVAVFLASLRLRLVMTPIDPKLGEAETRAVIEHVGARLMITKNGIQRTGLDGAGAAQMAFPPDGTVLLKLTSGSTGSPKAIALTDLQLLADSANICSTMGIRPADLNFGVIPLSHSYGFDNLIMPLIAQGTSMVMLDEIFPRAVIEGIASTRATVFPAVPFLLEMLNHQPDPLPKMPSLRTVISAGAPLSAEVYHTFRQRFGLRIHQFYGSSECGGITYVREPSDEFIIGCVGKPMDNVTVDLVEDGRVRVCGANVASGYWPPLPPNEEQVLGNDTYLTGDIGRFDETGRLHLIGRVASFINVAGRKVNPVEIEQCIAELPAIQNVAVLGVADASRHESIAAFVVVRDGASIETDKLLQHCRARLASWKVPRAVKVIDALPLTTSGKLDRMALKQQV
jgi:long-chain acyl-CoA synthetase